MRALFRLAIVIAVAWLGYTQVWPRYEEYRRARSANESADESARLSLACLAVAESTTSDFSREIVQFELPPVDPALWSTFLIRASSRLGAADSTCRCPSEACISASAALLEQRKVLNHFDARVRGTVSAPVDLAAAMKRIDRLLARARAEAR